MLLKGKCIYVTDDFERALRYYKKVAEIKPETTYSHFHIGNLLMLNGDFEGAINSYKKVSKIKETASAYYQTAKCLILLEDPIEAIKILEMAVKLHNLPTYVRDLESLKIFKENISFEKAEEHFTKMLNEIDEKEIAHEISFKGEGNTDYCKSDMESIYKFPIFEVEDWTTYRALMRLYIGKYTDALKDFEILLEILLCKKMKYFEAQAEELEAEINFLRFSPVTINECRYNIMLCYLLVYKEFNRIE